MKKQFIAAAALALATTASAQVYVADNGNLIAPMEGDSTNRIIIEFDDNDQCRPAVSGARMLPAMASESYESSPVAYRVDKNDVYTFTSQIHITNNALYSISFSEWSFDTAAIIAEMKAGQTLRIRSTNSDGDFVYRVYHLNGFTAAYAQAEALCTPSDTAGFFE